MSAGRRSRTVARVLAVAVAVSVLGGCARIDALRPVSPDQRTKVRFAAIDVLESQGVDIRDAPRCEVVDRRKVTCTGSTADGESILVVSPADQPAMITITVGEDTVYDGPIDDILIEGAEPS